MSNLVLSLDLSTASTGFAVFSRNSKKLEAHGRLTPKVAGIHKLRYPEAALLTIRDMSKRVRELVLLVNPTRLVIEEINRGISRIGQKTLNGLHFFVLDEIMKVRPDLIRTLTYIDSNGRKGWRGLLGLKLSEQDKQVNAEIRLKNRRKKSGKAPLIDWKVLAQRWVNSNFKKSFNVWENPGDNDECDAIALGSAFIRFLDKI